MPTYPIDDQVTALELEVFWRGLFLEKTIPLGLLQEMMHRFLTSVAIPYQTCWTGSYCNPKILVRPTHALLCRFYI